MNGTVNRIPDDYFWRLVDDYESGDRSVRGACADIISAHKRFGIKNLNEAIADYERLTGRDASTFVKNCLKKGLQIVVNVI
jgi:hypothetical protein